MAENPEPRSVEATESSAPPKADSSRLDYLQIMKDARKRGADPASTAKAFEGACFSAPDSEKEETSGSPPMFPGVERKFENFDLLRSERPFDPKKHTVAILDDFTKATFSPNGPKKPGLAHGEVTAAAAEAAGFNVLRLQTPSDNNLSFGATFDEIADAMKSGKLPLKKGDLINISLGAEVPFKEVNCALQMDLTPENYGARREEVLAKMVERVKTAKMHPMDKGSIEFALDSVEGIERMKKLGIDVVHSAGNDGSDRVELDMLNAKYQLSAAGPDGKVYPWSAQHSATLPYRGSFVLEYQPAELMWSKPIHKQSGYYQLDGTNVRLPAEKFGGAGHYQRVERDEEGDPVTIKVDPLVLRPENLTREKSTEHSFVPGPTLRPVNWMRALSFDQSRALPVVPQLNTTPQPYENSLIKPQDRRRVDVLTGTSFSNVTFWEQRRKELDAAAALEAQKPRRNHHRQG